MDFESVASRICTLCGMCCNGVLFQIVRLQPEDSVKELEALGMKIGRRKKDPYFKQPCRFLRDCHCEIYSARPMRCRDFDCRQLQLLEAREVTEDEVMQLVDDVKRRVARIEALLEAAGNVERDASLADRFAQVRESGEQSHRELNDAMTGLGGILNRNFRVRPLPGEPAG